MVESASVLLESTELFTKPAQERLSKKSKQIKDKILSKRPDQ